MTELLRSILAQVHLSTVVDIGITALLIYWLFSLIRGTRAVRLVIGVSVLILVYFLAVALNFILLTRILQGGAVVGLFGDQTEHAQRLQVAAKRHRRAAVQHVLLPRRANRRCVPALPATPAGRAPALPTAPAPAPTNSVRTAHRPGASGRRRAPR